MNALQALAAIPQWAIGLFALAGLILWIANYGQAIKNDSISGRIRSGFGIAFEFLVLVLVIAYYAVR